MDAYKNFAVSKVATAPSPATTGTSLVVTAGNGTYFSANANAVICPDGEQPTWSNAEIVRVTAISTDTLTITRAQEGTTARSVVVGDVIYQGITDKWLDDLLNGQFIVDATGKTTPVDADTMPLIDSADSNKLKKLTWANLKATIKAYYDSVTATLTNKTLTSPKINEDVALTATATELNQLDGKTVGGTASGDIVTVGGTQTLTGKTIDADDNTLKDLTVGVLKSGVLDTDLSSTSGSDDTLASAKAIKSLFNTVSDVNSFYYSSGNGHIKFDCGLQIAWKVYSVSSLGGTMWDTTTNVWYSDHSMGNWTSSFSQLFVTFPSVRPSQYWAGHTGQSATSAGTVRVFRPNSVTASGTINIVGFGSWS